MNAKPKTNNADIEGSVQQIAQDQPICGIIMPIATLGTYPEAHWKDVRKIIDAAITKAQFMPNMVSESSHIGVILKRIVQNIYDNPIVVCDVSGKNPNVMFELGMRLAFDKPVVIIKDEQTDYSFDTSVIEHVPYRRDLRIHETQAFIELLSEKIVATYKESQSNNKFSAFLKHFGTFEVAGLEHKTGSADEVILETMKEMQETMALLVSREKISRKASNPQQFLDWAVLPGMDADDVETARIRSVVRKVLSNEGFRDPEKVYMISRKILSDSRTEVSSEKIGEILDQELNRRRLAG